MGARQRMGDDLLIELWCKVFFSIFIFPFPVFGPWFLVPVPCVPSSVLRSPYSVLRSPFSLRCCPFSVLRFPVSRCSFSASRSPRSSFLVFRYSSFFKLLNNEVIVWKYIISFEWKNNQKLELLDVSMFWLMVAEELKQMIQSPYGFNGKIYFFPCVC